MEYGDNYIETYSTVEGGATNPGDSSTISGGGTGGSQIVTYVTTFLWVYDPNDDDLGGFTGGSWLVGVAGTPLASWSSLDDVRNHFATYSNLDVQFSIWSQYVTEEHEKGNDNVVSNFQRLIYTSGGSFSCWQTVTFS